MADSKTTPAPKKPRHDFPLTPRGDGRWCKRVLGRLRYFTGTAQEALDEWNRVKDYWLAGREAPPKGGYLTLSDLVNQFLHHKKLRVQSGELAEITWAQYEATGKLLVEFFGRSFPAEQLQPSDFQRFRANLAAEVGPATLANRINVVRMIFKYGHKTALLSKPASFSVEFDKPSRKTLRQAKAAKGEQLFTPEQIKTLLKVAEPPMRAMILLAINGGLGNNDLALLKVNSCDLETGWLDYPRPKTAMPRRIPLWGETVEAVELAFEKRNKPKDKVDEDKLFIGKLGSSYVSTKGGHRIAHEFGGLCDRAGVKGRVFYDLRRTFQTIADNSSRDRDGVKAIMGHAPSSSDMSAIYRQRFDDERLRRIVNQVHAWLYTKSSRRQ